MTAEQEYREARADVRAWFRADIELSLQWREKFDAALLAAKERGAKARKKANQPSATKANLNYRPPRKRWDNSEVFGKTEKAVYVP